LKDKHFEELSIINWISQQINDNVLENLKLNSWRKLVPVFNEIQKTSEAYSRMILLVDHFYDLRLFDDVELIEADQMKLKAYTDEVGLKIQHPLQTVLDSLVIWIEIFPFDEETCKNSEEEQGYFNALINIKDNIFPEPKGDEEDYEVIINMRVVSRWIERLKICTENWGLFLLLLNGKYTNKYKGITYK
jgi:hypothetical protein